MLSIMGKKLFLVTTLGTRPSSFNKKLGVGSVNSFSGIDITIREKKILTNENNSPKPKRKVHYNKNNVSIIEAFFEYNEGVIIIEALNHKDAYNIYILMKFYLDLFKDPFKKFFELEEIKFFPVPSLSINEFHSYFCRNNEFDVDEFTNDILCSKLIFDCTRIEKCILFIQNTGEDIILIESIKHFLESISLFGIWSGEVTYLDYLRELELYDIYKENDYNENGFKYELAFTAAFKGIECFFNKKDFKNRDDIQKSIEKCNYPNIKANMEYEYMFEKEINQKRTDKLEYVIGRFRDMRNASGAHNRMDTPIEKRIYRESVFEIQSLLRKLILLKYLNKDFLGFSF